MYIIVWNNPRITEEKKGVRKEGVRGWREKERRKVTGLNNS